MPRKQGSGSSPQTKRNYNARHNKVQARSMPNKTRDEFAFTAPQNKG